MNHQSCTRRSLACLAFILACSGALIGCANPDGKVSLGTLDGTMYQMSSGTELPFQIERSKGTGGLWATNPKTGERFKGQYTGRFNDGGSSSAVVRSPTGGTSTVTAYTPPTSANAKGYLRGDKGTMIDVYLDITPGIVPRGTGEGIDNSGGQYRISF